MQAAAQRARAAAPDATVKSDAFLAPLSASVETFEQLAELMKTYDSLSDVPAWHPTRLEKVPFHWTDIVPLLQRELAIYRSALNPKGPPPSREPTLPGLAGLQYGESDWKRVQGSDPITTLDFHWDNASSNRGRSWSAEWRGFLIAPHDGKLTLRVQTDQQVWLDARDESAWDGKMITGSRDLTLTVHEGEAVPLCIRYNQPLDNQTFFALTWSVNDGDFASIPAAALRHSESDASWSATVVLLNSF